MHVCIHPILQLSDIQIASDSVGHAVLQNRRRSGLQNFVASTPNRLAFPPSQLGVSYAYVLQNTGEYAAFCMTVQLYCVDCMHMDYGQ